MKRLMIIAGGNWQIPLIKKAKELGYEVVNTNLYKDSPGFEYADYSEVADVLDKETNLNVAKKYQIDGVMTDQSDIAVPTVAYVAEQMGCPTIGCEMAELFTNKFKMRAFCEKEGFAVPEYKLCTTLEEAEEFFEKLQRKAIIKPLNSQASCGIFTIENIDELRDKFSVTSSFTNGDNKVLIERYLEGTEFTIDGIVVEGKHYSLAISEKGHFEYNKNIANKLFFSYSNDRFDYDELRRCNDQLYDKTGIRFGITHAEYKYEDGKYYLIEMAARGGGTKISSDIVPYMSGIDNYKILIQSVLGQKSDFEYETYISNLDKERCAVLEFLDIESQGKRISGIYGVEEIKSIPEVVEFGLEFSVGDMITKADSDRTRVGRFIVCAENRDKVNKISKQIKEILKIEYEE